MKKHDDYVSGPHHYWMHFLGGFLFGAGLAAWIASWLFNSGLAAGIGAIAGGLSLGFFCGRWGEVAWKQISDWLQRWWRLIT
jgi:hypothetical protein